MKPRRAASSRFDFTRRAAVPCLLGLLAMASTAWSTEPPLYRLDTTSGYQGEFKFGGIALTDGVSQLKRQYPTAAYDYREREKRAGLECYVVADAKVADEARFFFFDAGLYQMEIVYRTPRIEDMGGTETLRRHLTFTLGPADHTDQVLHTWRRLGWRADLYTPGSEAELVITDTNFALLVEQRIQRATPGADKNFGFRRVAW